MKCTTICVGSSNVSKTWEQFLGSEYKDYPLGKLLVALVAEQAWSRDYKVFAQFGDRPYLNIDHPAFTPSRSLVVEDALSLRDVEDAVRKHLRTSQEEIRPSINLLQGRVNNMEQALSRIDKDKARAAILKTFPGAKLNDADHYQGSADLHSYGKLDGTILYVARAVDHEFVGGVARLNLSSQQWYGMQDGISQGQRHNVFWAALARSFVRSVWNVPEEDCYCEVVYATEKPWKWPQPEPYIVEKVALRIPADKNVVLVKFGPDNLPLSVRLTSNSEQKVAEL
jgi:hypothetical protein